MGSTGSVGRNTLDVVARNPERFRVEALSCHGNLSLLREQIEDFRPSAVCVGNHRREKLLSMLGSGFPDLRVLEGKAGLEDISRLPEIDKVVAGISGSEGLGAVFAAVGKGKEVILANKEPLVVAGRLIMETARRKGASILPIDSEHNAVFQALGNNRLDEVKSITLMASGGPFLRTPKEEFGRITVAEALKHPNWEMGKKITVDSATLMNKSLEVIEAARLFGLPGSRIEVVVHPQSILHSMVTFRDESTLAQLSLPDMRVPISYCLADRGRIPNGAAELDLGKISTLEFMPLDRQKFPTVDWAYLLLEMPEGAGAMFNGANEALVEAFLAETIPFTWIFAGLERLMKDLENGRSAEGSPLPVAVESVEEGFEWNEKGRRAAGLFVEKARKNGEIPWV